MISDERLAKALTFLSTTDEDLAELKAQVARKEYLVKFTRAKQYLCHIKRGWCGSLKPPDVVAVWGCNRCHDAIDGRVRTQYTKVELDSMILRALCEQLCVYVKQEVLSW